MVIMQIKIFAGFFLEGRRYFKLKVTEHLLIKDIYWLYFN